MTELRDYILSKLQEQLGKAERNPAGQKAVADWKMKRRVGREGSPVRVGQSDTGENASIAAEKEAGKLTGKLLSRGPKGLGQTKGGMRNWSNVQQGHSADARQNASTDLRTQLAYVLADKLEELKLPQGGIERNKQGRAIRGGKYKAAVAKAGFTAITGRQAPEKVNVRPGGEVDVGTPESRADLPKYPKGDPALKRAGRQFQKSGPKAGLKRPPRPKEEPPKPENASTDLRTQLMYILADKIDEIIKPDPRTEKLVNPFEPEASDLSKLYTPNSELTDKLKKIIKPKPSPERLLVPHKATLFRGKK